MALPIRLKSKPVVPATLVTVTVNPSNLVRVSRHNTGEPYFGTHQGNRFDDPESDPAARYGTCYFGDSFDAAVAETLLHDRSPENGYFLSGSMSSVPAITSISLDVTWSLRI